MKMSPLTKIMTVDEAIAWKAKTLQGKKLVATNGAYDMLHPGHAQYLNDARNLGDALLIAVNSDSSVKIQKGPKRPIVPEDDRLYLLASLEAVDAVVLFDSEKPKDILVDLKPEIYVKGGDYTIDTIDQEERKLLESQGATIQIIRFREGFSTTDMIAKVLDSYSE